MLQVKIDLIPHGQETERKTIENIYIWNIGTVAITDAGHECRYLASRVDPRNDKMAVGDIQLEHVYEQGAAKLVEKVLSMMPEYA